jgi:hypothetical protein
MICVLDLSTPAGLLRARNRQVARFPEERLRIVTAAGRDRRARSADMAPIPPGWQADFMGTEQSFWDA